MGFTISPQGNRSRLVVFIDYQFPPRGFAQGLALLFGRTYAAWCTRRMATDAVVATAGIAAWVGSEDHYVPMEQWHDQIRMLENARSITARLFTRSESAQNHCQVGNFGLALRTIVNWLDEMLVEKAEKVDAQQATGKKVAPVVKIESNPSDIGIESGTLQSGTPSGAQALSGLSP